MPFVVDLGGDPFTVGIESFSGAAFSSLDITDTCTVTPGQPVEMVRVHKGSIVKAASGSFPKRTSRGVRHDGCAHRHRQRGVGGGASGQGTSIADASSGGTPSNVAVETLAYDDIGPDAPEGR